MTPTAPNSPGRPALSLPDDITEFYQEKAARAGRDLSEEIAVALREHMDMLRHQSHQPVPGQDTVQGDPGSGVDTPSVPY